MKKLIFQMFLSLFLDKKARNTLKANKQKKNNLFSSSIQPIQTSLFKVKKEGELLKNGNKLLKQDNQGVSGEQDFNNKAILSDRKTLIKEAVAIHREKQILLKKLPKEKRAKLREIALALLGQELTKKQ